MAKETQEFAPTIAGNTGMVYTKKQLAAIKRRQEALAKALTEWEELPETKARCLENIGGVCIGHPTEKVFGGSKDQIITIKKVDFKQLEKAGLVEKV